MENDNKYPYTYACDYLRRLVDFKISRAEASEVRHGIAEALGMGDDELARKLADCYKAKKGIFDSDVEVPFILVVEDSVFDELAQKKTPL